MSLQEPSAQKPSAQKPLAQKPLADHQWHLLSPALRILLAGHSQALWQLEDRSAKGPSQGTVYDRFRRWASGDTLERTVCRLQGELDAEGRIDQSRFNVDSTAVQAARVAAGGPNGDKRTERR